MAYGDCPTCEAFYVDLTFHKCPPQWRVWNVDESEEDGHTFYARDAEYAVEKWAEYDDTNSAEYHIAQGGKAAVFVKQIDTDEPPKKFSVTGEYEPVYYAIESKS